MCSGNRRPGPHESDPGSRALPNGTYRLEWTEAFARQWNAKGSGLRFEGNDAVGTFKVITLTWRLKDGHYTFEIIHDSGRPGEPFTVSGIYQVKGDQMLLALHPDIGNVVNRLRWRVNPDRSLTLTQIDGFKADPTTACAGRGSATPRPGRLWPEDAGAPRSAGAPASPSRPPRHRPRGTGHPARPPGRTDRAAPCRGRVRAAVAVITDAEVDAVPSRGCDDLQPGGTRMLEHVRHRLGADEVHGLGQLSGNCCRIHAHIYVKLQSIGESAKGRLQPARAHEGPTKPGLHQAHVCPELAHP